MNIKFLTASFLLLLLSSCATKYVTPGGNVQISALADEDISKVLSNKPTAEFPVTIAVARIQAPKYSNHRYSYNNPVPNGNFSMILTRSSIFLQQSSSGKRKFFDDFNKRPIRRKCHSRNRKTQWHQANLAF